MTFPPNDASARWLDRFFEAFWAHRPVHATFAGVRGLDDRLPNVSVEGVATAAAAERALLGSASPAPVAHPVADPNVIDRRLAEGFLRIQLWEHESRWQLSNPSVYASEAVFALLSLLLPASAPREPGSDVLGERAVDALIGRMNGLDRYLGDARGWLDRAPVAWTERALRECRGGLAFLREGLGEAMAHPAGPLRATHSRRRRALETAAERAAAALEAYAAFLESELLARPAKRVGCGAGALALHLREGHFLRRSAEEIAAEAREQMRDTWAWLVARAAEHGADTPGAALARLADAHPTADGYLGRYASTWRHMKATAEARELVTWPDLPLRWVERPGWARAAAPDLDFLFYRSPAVHDRSPVHDYLVAPLPEGSRGSSAPADEVEAFLRAHNDSVIKLSHVVQHGGLGHHVQNGNAFRSPSRVGRVAAVDGAARIAMLCGGTMAEGWACYATDLMEQVGVLEPLEAYAVRSARVRMAARAVVDVELHHGRMSLEEAASFYAETAGMNEGAARAEAVRNSMFPGAALVYLVGTDLIHELRADLSSTLGDDFVLRDFHDAFLSWGSIPVKVVADEMRARAERGLPLHAREIWPSAADRSG